jgi:hypothetical protein
VPARPEAGDGERERGREGEGERGSSVSALARQSSPAGRADGNCIELDEMQVGTHDPLSLWREVTHTRYAMVLDYDCWPWRSCESLRIGCADSVSDGQTWGAVRDPGHSRAPCGGQWGQWDQWGPRWVLGGAAIRMCP